MWTLEANDSFWKWQSTMARQSKTVNSLTNQQKKLLTIRVGRLMLAKERKDIDGNEYRPSGLYPTS